MKFRIKNISYKIRKIKKSDVSDYFEIARHSDKYITDEAFTDINEAKLELEKMYFSKEAKQNAKGFAIVDVKLNKMIGIVEFHSYDKNYHQIEIGYVMHLDYQNQGIMKEAVKRVVDFGFRKYNYNAIFAKTLNDNVASVKILNHCGFKLLHVVSKKQILEEMTSYVDLCHFILERNEYLYAKTKRNV